ncbi:MAG TPA: hypothetical protein VD835_09975 [Pyrinomonadaceae bacterium]|nr:hypothetical protein [Pyrinomonadaceae bacterium]
MRVSVKMNWPMQLEGGCLPKTVAVRTRIYPQTRTHRNRLRAHTQRTQAAPHGNRPDGRGN